LVSQNDAKQYANYFKKDSVVLFPTDTVVGLGCRFDSAEAISRIRKLKGIVDKNPLAVLISDKKQLDFLKVRRSPLSNILMQEFWPGALTIVLTAENAYPCSGDGNSIGLRMPDAEFLRKIIETIGVPLAATSANLHNSPAPAKLKDVGDPLRAEVDHIVEFETASSGLASTVVRIEGGILKIMREGAITGKEILEAVGDRFESTGI
jgi:L-threonylcarbamoyladenylate synthase